MAGQRLAPVAYSTDLDEAIEIIKRTSDELWHDPAWRGLVLEEPDVWGVEEFGDSAILIRLVIKVVPAQQWARTARPRPPAGRRGPRP